MKRLLFLFLFLFAASSQAASFRIWSSITFTNFPTNGATLNARTWTNNVSSSPGTLITQTNSIPYSATNLLNHLTTYPLASGHYLTQSNSTNVTIEFKVGEFLSITPSAGYASVLYFTNTVGTPTLGMRAPRLVESATNRQFVAQAIIDYLSSDSTNAITTNAVALTNYVSTGPHPQNIIGVKTFLYGVGGTNAGLTNGVITGARETNVVGLHGDLQQLTGGLLISVTSTNATITNAAAINGAIVLLNGGIIDGTRFTNILALNGTVYRLTNGYYTNATLDLPTLTNGVNYGNAFSSPGSGSLSEQLGSGAIASGDQSAAFGYLALASGNASTAIGNNAQATNESATALGAAAWAYGQFSLAAGLEAQAYADNGSALGAGAVVASTHTNSTAVGFGSATTAKNQVALGSSTVAHIYTPGRIEAGSITNAVHTGTNQVLGDWANTTLTVSSFANGTNRIDATNVVIRIASGPTAAFSIAGISGGRDGRILELYNDTGQAMTVNHESGIESTAANRIRTGAGADVTYGTNVYMTLRYFGTINRWVVRSANPAP